MACPECPSPARAYLLSHGAEHTDLERVTYHGVEVLTTSHEAGIILHTFGEHFLEKQLTALGATAGIFNGSPLARFRFSTTADAPRLVRALDYACVYYAQSIVQQTRGQAERFAKEQERALLNCQVGRTFPEWSELRNQQALARWLFDRQCMDEITDHFADFFDERP